MSEIDPTSVAGMSLPVDEETDLLVIGAGVAGCTAAIEAVGRGLKVVLVDENPVDAETMGDEIPLHFGGRMSGAARNRNAMMEAVLERMPLIAEAFEAGVDVRLSTACWGLFTSNPTACWIARPIAGLADVEGVRHLAFDNVVVATGSRDLGLAFPGWELPGVMGAIAANRLATRYGALDSQRFVMLGGAAEALSQALSLMQAGLECAAVIEAAETIPGPSDLLDRIAESGSQILTGHVIAKAEGGADGVSRVVARAIDSEGRHVAGSDKIIDCDTVTLGIAAVPVIELLEAAGCRIEHAPRRGGHVPVLVGGQNTTVSGIHAIGDAAGFWPEKSMNSEIATAEARRAVTAIIDGQADVIEPVASGHGGGADQDTYLKRWVRASLVEADAEGDGEPFVCQCEDVTARDILEVRPPRYLGWSPPTQKPSDLASLLGAGPPNPDQVKRLTRAGMGVCQGRRCREQVAALLALESGVPISEIPLATFRPPVRPIRLDQLATTNEAAEMSDNWEGWFGIPSMWLAPWQIGPDGRPLEDLDDD
jgi:thioredoxin reductase